MHLRPKPTEDFPDAPGMLLWHVAAEGFRQAWAPGPESNLSETRSRYDRHRRISLHLVITSATAARTIEFLKKAQAAVLCDRTNREERGSARRGFFAKTGQNLGPAPQEHQPCACLHVVKKHAYSADVPFRFNSSSTGMPR